MAIVGGAHTVDLLPCLRSCYKTFGAGFDPAHRLAQAQAGDDSENLLWVELAFCAEAAPDIWCYDPDIGRKHAQHSGEKRAHKMGELGGSVEGEPGAAGIRVGDNTAGFHGCGSGAVNTKFCPDRMLCLRKCQIDIANFLTADICDIRSMFRVKQGCILGCLLRI
jgi:hypothetical protein